MDDRGGTGRNLVVVERDKDVLHVAAVDAVAVPVDNVGVDKMRPGVDPPEIVDGAAAADEAVFVSGRDLEPELVGIGSPLGEVVADAEGADDDLDQIAAAWCEGRHIRPQWSDQRGNDGAAIAQTEDVDAGRGAQELPVGGNDLFRVLQTRHHRQGRVGGGEEVVVNGQAARAVVVGGAELRRLAQGHVAPGAVGDRPIGEVEGGHAVSRNTAEQERVVVVLAAKPLVGVELLRNVDLVAGAAELRRAVEGFEKGGLVELGFAFDELTVEPLQRRVGGVGEGVVLRPFDDVVGVAARARDGGDGVAASCR